MIDLEDENGNQRDENAWQLFQQPQQQNSGIWNPPPNVRDQIRDENNNPLPPAPSQSSGSNDAARAIAELNKKYGGQGVESDNAAKLARLAQNPSSNETFESYLRELEAKQQRRTAPTSSRPFDSQSSNYNQATNQLSSQGRAAMERLQVPSPQVGAQFSDPITSWIEQFAQQRAQQRENPSANSGQALLEQALRDISAQFQKGGFTPAEQEVFQTQAIDPLEQLRQARKQQVLQSLSARNITPESGVAIQMLADVDRQFDAQRATTQRGLAAQGAQETQARMMQALQLLSGLAGTENQRLNEAFQYRSVPLNLADRAFNQASSLYNQAGNPLSLINPLMQLGSLQQGRSDSQQAALADLIWALTRGL